MDREKVMITQSESILTLNVFNLTAWERIVTHFICESFGMKPPFICSL